jgi:hypothetical protein
VFSNPVVQRHYQITPATNPTTATGTITLYFTQADFDAFNAAPGSTVKLPTGPLDAAGIANLRIGKYSGTSSDGSGLPATYTSTSIVIDPADANIVWNATDGFWGVTFDVTGFSGFVVQTSTIVLPIDLVSFGAEPIGSVVQVSWTTSKEINNDHFELERSTDGQTFTSIATIPAMTGNGTHNYLWTDQNAASLNSAKLLYRLKIVGLAGSVEYSNILVVGMDITDKVTVGAANPFKGSLQLNIHVPAGGTMAVNLGDVNGRMLIKDNLSVPGGFSTQALKGTEKLATGIYFVSVYFEKQRYTFKVIKQD